MTSEQFHALLTNPHTSALLDRMREAGIAENAREAARLGLTHRCGCCGQLAPRIDQAANGELAVYQCDACGKPTIVDRTRLPRVEGR